MSAKKNGMDFLVGILVGMALGTTTALLLAPKTGRQVRELLVKEARKLASKTSRQGLDTSHWSDLAAEQAGRFLVENLHDIRSAGL